MSSKNGFNASASVPGVAVDGCGAQNTYTLLPGDVAMGFDGDVLETLLGSCVSVILTDPRRTTGVMCHILHSLKAPAAEANNTAYATQAMQSLFALLRSVGIAPEMCEAFVYGGGNMFPQIFSKFHVGIGNADWALDFLESHAIPVVEQSVGGAFYRKVRWSVGARSPQVVETATHVSSNG